MVSHFIFSINLPWEGWSWAVQKITSTFLMYKSTEILLRTEPWCTTHSFHQQKKKKKAFIPAHSWRKGEVWGELWGAQTRAILKACRNIYVHQLQQNSCKKKWYWEIFCCLISASYWLFFNIIRVIPALLHDLTPQFLCPIIIIYRR